MKIFDNLSHAQQLRRARKDPVICVLIVQAKRKGHAVPIKCFYASFLQGLYCITVCWLIGFSSTLTTTGTIAAQGQVHRVVAQQLLRGQKRFITMICARVFRAHTISIQAKTDIFAHYFTFADEQRFR